MKKILLFFLMLPGIPAAYAQTTYDIDFSYESLNGNCNVFASALTIDNFKHKTVKGFPSFTGNPDYFVNLPCKRNSSSSQVGTEYQIIFPFKKDHKYQITVHYKGTKDASTTYFPSVALGLNETEKPHNTATTCTAGPQSLSQNDYFYFGASGPTFAWTAQPIDLGTLTKDYASLSVAGFPDVVQSVTGNCAIQIRAIKIVETPVNVTPSFTLAPASLTLSCGSAAPQTFTVTNVNNLPGVTAYNWDLSAASNGWLYNGAPAGQFISTATNTLTLTPVCGDVQKNVKAVVAVGSNNYSTNTVTVTNTLPSMSITGNNVVGSTESYTVSGLPCNANVSWSVAPAGVVSMSCAGCPQTSLTRVSDGNITLTATVAACGQTQTLTKQLTVCDNNIGVPTGLTGTLTWPYPSTYGYVLSFTTVPGAQYYNMEWFDVTNNSLLNTYPVQNSGHLYYYFSAGRTYKYRLAAVTGCGTGAFSAWSGLLEPPPASCANGPLASTLNYLPGCNGSPGCPYTNLLWPAISGASQYRVEYSIVNTSTGQSYPSTVITTSNAAASPALPSLNGAGWTIQFRVGAYCSGTWGNYSGWSARFFLQ